VSLLNENNREISLIRLNPHFSRGRAKIAQEIVFTLGIVSEQNNCVYLLANKIHRGNNKLASLCESGEKWGLVQSMSAWMGIKILGQGKTPLPGSAYSRTASYLDLN